MNRQYTTCRYNKNHKVLISRLILHESRCPDSKSKNLKTCPFNISHKISNEKFEKHVKNCPNRPKIEQSLKEQIFNYIKGKNNNEEVKNDVQIDNEKLINIDNIYNCNYEGNIKNENPKFKKIIDLQKCSNQEIFNFMDNGIVDYDEDD